MSTTTKLEALFDGAVGLDVDAVGPFLERECEGDDALRREVLALLAADRSDAAPERIAEEALAAELLPSAIGTFEIVRRLGAGGMGVVYEAKDARLDRRVAIKVVHAGTTAALLDEARAFAKVVHPNVVAIHEVGHAAGEDFIVMELVDGATLASWLQASARGWQEVLAMFVAAGRGLAAAHAAGVVHRDFKPENVLVGVDGRPRVVDFGAGMLGTPAYMAPEQMRGKALDARCDQFAFAVALYRALYGRPPFEGDDIVGLLDSVLAGRRAPVPRSSEVPPEIGAAIERALAREPGDRFASMDELLAVVGADSDRAVSRSARRIAAAVLTVVGVLTARSPVAATTPGLISLGFVALVTMLVLGLVFRRKLLANAYNRRIAVLFVLPVLGFIVHRTLAIRLGSSIADILVADAIAMAVLLAYAAFTLERWLGIPAILALLYAGAATLYPAWAAPGFGGLLCISATVPIVFWQAPKRSK